jgi:hypothetical protein
MNRFLATLLAVATSAAWAGCNTPICGPGTKQVQQRDGSLQCQPVEGLASGIVCDTDAGASIVGGNDCVSHIKCGDNTVYDPATGRCNGTGMAGGLPTCTAPVDGTICVVGQIYHFLDDSPLAAGENVQVALYNPQDFLATGPATTPLASGTTSAGGYYKFDHISPGVGLIALGVGTGPNVIVATGAQVAGNNAYQLDGYTADRSVVDGWKQGTQDYFATGAYVAKFYAEKFTNPNLFTVFEKTHVGGVTFTKCTSSCSAYSGVKYFSSSLTTIDPTLTSTSAQVGAALIPGSKGIETLSGMGGTIGGQTPTWAPPQPGGSYAGVLFVARYHPM